MCVAGGVETTAGMPSSSDSDINYDDGDSGEWQSSSSSSSVESGGQSKELPPSSPWSLGGVPVPSNLIRWNDPPSADPRSHHAHVRSRMHHVRHEQHYLQGHHRASKPNKWHSVPEVDGPRVVHDENHPKGRHGHQNHHNKHHNHHRTAETASSTESSTEDSSVARHVHRHRQQLTDEFGVPKDISPGLSIERGASLGPRKHYQQVANRKRSTSSFHSEPPSMNALEHSFPSQQERDPLTTKNATSKSQYTLRSANPESKSYFEYLLNNYKSHSPLYKEHNAQQQQQQQQKLQTVQPQTRSLTKAKQQRGSGSSSSSSSNQKATSSKPSKGKQSDIEYDYSYEDEDDDEVQNDGAYGEVVQTTTTSRPRRTTTTVATTTTRTTTTTTEASQESSSGDGDSGSGGGGGDNQYALYIQSATRMKNTQHRNGNNKFSSHSKHAANNPVDPAKQVHVPPRYSSFTDYKQANFGTKEAVARSYQSYKNHNAQVQAHLDRVARLGACKVPKPKVIPVPSNGTYYFLPERTILHRCDDETACCESSKRCEAKHTETVTLYFYITTLDKTSSGKSATKVSGKSGPKANVQMRPHVIHMTNHTECHCVTPRSSTSTTEQPVVSSGTCKCPLHFQPVMDSDYDCYCACQNSRNCGNFTEGNESFSLDDRKCINSGVCTQPSCKYGTYDRASGKCPARRDQIDQVIPKNRRNHYR
uniref:Putative histone acetyltransferase kat6b-like protein n=1 Tax=Anopheles marajoara TaxID=58244 RepID=A0A2M4BFQ9_9DIPT